MPVPMARGVLDDVSRTCSELMQGSAEDVTLDDDAINTFVAELSPSAVLSSAVCVRIPIRFDSLLAEVNYLAIFNLLDCGSGFDGLLQQKTGRGAHETIQFGLLGMLMTEARLDSAVFLREFSAFQVFNFFGVDASEESEVMPGITLTRQGPLGEFVHLIRDTLNETGRILGDTGSCSLGAFVLSALDARRAAGQPPSAAALVEALRDTFPAFDDRQDCQGLQVCFYRKAQALAAQLFLRFGGEDERFAFADLDAITLDSGNVLPAVLRQRGVLQYSPAMASVVDGGEDLSGDPKAAILRAAAVEAGNRICKAAAAAGGASGGGSRASGSFMPYQLSLYLLHMADTQAEYQGLKKHVCKGTVAY